MVKSLAALFPKGYRRTTKVSKETAEWDKETEKEIDVSMQEAEKLKTEKKDKHQNPFNWHQNLKTQFKKKP